MIKLEINTNQIKTDEGNDSLAIHYLPAKIDEDGTANVDRFFSNYTTEENGCLTNALRGYPLLGNTFDVPEGFKGVVFQETKKPLDENAERVFKASGCFDKFTYWNYDKVPSKADYLRQALQFVDLADEISKPVSLEDIEREMADHDKIKTED